MAINFIRRNDNGLLSAEDFDLYKAGLRRGANKAEKLLWIPDVNVNVLAKPRSSRHGGITGFAFAEAVYMQISLDKPCYRDPDNIELHQELAHELHHHARGPVDDGYTFGDAFVREGLAQIFVTEATGTSSDYSSPLTEEQILSGESFVKSILDQPMIDPDYQREVFMGSNDKNKGLPHWFGYGFSYALVNAGLRHLQQTAAEAVYIETASIIQPWLDGKFSVIESVPRPTPGKPLKSTQLFAPPPP